MRLGNLAGMLQRRLEGVRRQRMMGVGSWMSQCWEDCVDPDLLFCYTRYPSEECP